MVTVTKCCASSALDLLSAQEDLLSASGNLEEFIRILQEFRRIPKNSYGVASVSSGNQCIFSKS